MSCYRYGGCGYGYGYGYGSRYGGYYGYGYDPYYYEYGTLTNDPVARNLCLTTPIRFNRAQNGFGPYCYTNTFGNFGKSKGGAIVYFLFGIFLFLYPILYYWIRKYGLNQNISRESIVWNTIIAMVFLAIIIIILIVISESKDLYNNLSNQFPSVLHTNNTISTQTDFSKLTEKEPSSPGYTEYLEKVKEIDETRRLGRIFYIILIICLFVMIVIFIYYLNISRNYRQTQSNNNSRYEDEFPYGNESRYQQRYAPLRYAPPPLYENENGRY